jgi:hypothetical protein
LKDLKATTKRGRVTRDEIVRQFAGEKVNPRSYNENFGQLSRWGYTGSLRGQHGGVWLTKQGNRRLAEATRKS